MVVVVTHPRDRRRREGRGEAAAAAGEQAAERERTKAAEGEGERMASSPCLDRRWIGATWRIHSIWCDPLSALHLRLLGLGLAPLGDSKASKSASKRAGRRADTGTQVESPDPRGLGQTRRRQADRHWEAVHQTRCTGGGCKKSADRLKKRLEELDQHVASVMNHADSIARAELIKDNIIQFIKHRLLASVCPLPLHVHSMVTGQSASKALVHVRHSTSPSKAGGGLSPAVRASSPSSVCRRVEWFSSATWPR